MHTYLVEHYWPGVTEEEFRSALARVRASAGDGALSFVHATLVPGDEAALCLVSAASAEVVDETYRRAGVPYERILDALDVGA